MHVLKATLILAVAVVAVCRSDSAFWKNQIDYTLGAFANSSDARAKRSPSCQQDVDQASEVVRLALIICNPPSPQFYKFSSPCETLTSLIYTLTMNLKHELNWYCAKKMDLKG